MSGTEIPTTAELVARDRERQGLPAVITDPTVLERVAAIVVTAPIEKAGEKARAA